MYYSPLQINSNIAYQEMQPPKWLQHTIVYYWEIKTNNLAAPYSVIPDACVDIVINCTNPPQIFLSPSVIKPVNYWLDKKETWFGIRFFPGSLAKKWNIDLSALQYKMLPLANLKPVLNKKIEAAIAGTTSLEERVTRLNAVFSESELMTDNYNKHLPTQVASDFDQ